MFVGTGLYDAEPPVEEPVVADEYVNWVVETERTLWVPLYPAIEELLITTWSPIPNGADGWPFAKIAVAIVPVPVVDPIWKLSSVVVTLQEYVLPPYLTTLPGL